MVFTSHRLRCRCVSPRVLVSLLLFCAEKTSEACCYETVTDAVEQQAKVKMPPSLPETCIGNHKSVAQNHAGLPLALHRSSSTGKCVYVCVFVRVCACAC